MKSQGRKGSGALIELLLLGFTCKLRTWQLRPRQTPQRTAQLRLSFEQKLKVLKDLNSEIFDNTPEEELLDEIQQADECKDKIFLSLAKLDNLGSATPPSSTIASTVTGMPPVGSHIRLPKLTIQPFDGEITRWTPFWESYESTIHKNSSLSAVDKFNYLRSLLRGPAQEAVSGLTLSTANYDGAIEILQKRFGNKQRIISHHVDILMNIEPVTSQNSVKALRRLHDTVEIGVRGLKALGIVSDLYGTLLWSVLINKLPSNLQLTLGRKIGEDEWTLDTILKEIVQEIGAREWASLNPTDSTTPHHRWQRNPPATASTLLASAHPQCCFCSQQHSSEKCQAVKIPEDHKQSLRKNGCCFICLRRGHINRECRTRMCCPNCSGRHHPSTCSESTPVTQKESTTTPSTDSTVAMNPNAASFQPIY